MRKKILVSLATLVVLACTFYIGYMIGDQKNDLKNQATTYEQALRSSWVKEGKPPLPTISINGATIGVVWGSYTWCSPLLSNVGNCVSVDASIPELKSTIVPAGSKIDTKAPKGIKEFTITNTNKDFNGDPYFVPKTKGKYLYKIHCEWSLDQGQSDYYFSVEVV